MATLPCCKSAVARAASRRALGHSSALRAMGVLAALGGLQACSLLAEEALSDKPMGSLGEAGAGGALIAIALDPEPAPDAGQGGAGGQSPLACGENEVRETADCPSACDKCENETCTIACGAPSDCAAKGIACPDGMSCSVECLNESSCRDTVIDCPSANGILTTVLSLMSNAEW